MGGYWKKKYDGLKTYWDFSCHDCKHVNSNDFDEPCCLCGGSMLFDGKEKENYHDATWVEDESNDDIVNHPSHYCRDGAMECFEEFVLIHGVEAGKIACLFNIHKYRYRAADKNGIEDLKKSDWYMRKYKELCNER